MKKTISYASIEKITYEFDELDIKMALLKYHKIAEYKSDRKLSCEVYESDSGVVAEITLVFEKESEGQEKE